MHDLEAVRVANQRYYAAFEAADLDAMSDLWERSPRSLCTHPGWSTLRGWGRVAASYMTLFQHSSPLQFLITGEQVEVVGDMAWVSLDENLLDGNLVDENRPGEDSAVTVAVINLFARTGDGWRMVAHHGSLVQAAIGPMG